MVFEFVLLTPRPPDVNVEERLLRTCRNDCFHRRMEPMIRKQHLTTLISGVQGGHITKSKCMIVFIADTGRILSGESMQCRNYLAHRFLFFVPSQLYIRGFESSLRAPILQDDTCKASGALINVWTSRQTAE